MKIILHDNNVFEALAIAHELGIDDLKQTCEDHIRATLTVHNACIFLPAALALENRISGKIIYYLNAWII